MNAHTPFDAKKDWSNPYCQNSSNDPMVDALLGNAYHVVRTVYCNLGNLKLLYDFLNQYGMVIGVQSEAELKALTSDAKYARIYGFSRAGDRQVTDYLYVEGDRTGILPDDTTATGSWITVATSGSAGGGTSSGEGAYIPWVYSNGSAAGGETTINVPDGTVGVPFIIVNGDMQYVGRGFEFNVDNLSVTLAQPLEEGDEVVFLLTGVPAVPDNPNVSDWIQINWLYNGGYASGGEQVIQIPYTFQSVPAIYKNGARYYAGMTENSYTVDAANQRILLTEPLTTNDRLIVTIGGESETLIMTDRTIQEVARSANVKDTEIILSTNTAQYLNDKKVIYDVVEQKIYGLPSLPTNIYIGSVSKGQLTYSPGNITVDLLPVSNEYTDALRSDLAAETGSELVTYKSALSGAIARNIHERLSDYVSVKDFGAIGDGVADDGPAINAAFLAAKKVFFPVGTYYHTQVINLQDRLTVDLRGAKIKPANTILTAAWVGNNLNDLHVVGGFFEGTGLDNTTGNGQLITLSNCVRAKIDGTHLTKSPNDGIRLVSCSYSSVLNVHAYNNLSIGVQDRDGLSNLIHGCYCNYNGDTGTVSNTGGRGILLWRSKKTLVSDCYTYNNTEYGFRNYSQTGDASASYQNVVTNLRAGDNLKIDIYSYNEEGSMAEIVFNNCTVRRTTQPQGSCVAIQGKNTNYIGGTIKKEGDRLTVPVFSIYQTTRASVRNVTIDNAGQLISLSSDVATQLSGLVAECSTISNGGNATYTNCYFTHGGSGTTDIGIDAGATTTPVIQACTFDGFYRCVSWTAQKMVLVNNVSINTTDVSIRMFGDGIANYWASGNCWDKEGNPDIISNFTKQGGPTAKPVIYVNNSAPTTLTWPVGAIAINKIPAVGRPKKWVCTVAGTPGTWVSGGNL